MSWSKIIGQMEIPAAGRMQAFSKRGWLLMILAPPGRFSNYTLTCWYPPLFKFR